MSDEKEFDIWMEGFVVTGNEATAKYYGGFKATSFKKACKKALKHNGISLDDGYYNEEKNTFYGCAFFDNEKDARKNFG